MQKPTRRTFSLDVTAEPHPEVREAELNELLWTLGIASSVGSSGATVIVPRSNEDVAGTPTSKDLANRRVHIALFTSPEHKDGTNQRECSTLQPHNLFFFIRIVFVGREWRGPVFEQANYIVIRHSSSPSCSSGGDSSCCLVSLTPTQNEWDFAVDATFADCWCGEGSTFGPCESHSSPCYSLDVEIKEIEEKSEKNVLSDFIIDLAGNGYDRQKKQSVGRRAVGPTAAHAYVSVLCHSHFCAQRIDSDFEKTPRGGRLISDRCILNGRLG
ncbi:hypothetical protein BLNAU_17679 [Blattamonas nauphoetae]|uniref:Uncharacterized protein n=1 Tax=Blattamonas nauphoetae TaxID=2049346 RepID=A0ABQ9X751_9EUKA|nr:hypothetical protein BLNAU_17679 [Blattamonas nauphoetae]